MELTRRQFLKAAGTVTVAGVVFAGCAIPERELIKQSPRDLPEDLVAGLDDWYATSCGLCNGGHGIIVRVVEGRAKKVEGNPDHPVNRGKLMAHCLAGVQALYHPDRLAGPLRLRPGAARGSGEVEPLADWDLAFDELVHRLRAADPARTVLITEPLRGHLGYVALTFAQATGIRHMALEPTEQTVLRRAVKEVFGQDRLPHFDIANAETILSIGADFLETWLSPVQYNRAYGEFRQGAGRRRGTLIHADSRFSMTGANADIWLPVAPGQEGVLALSIAYVLVSERRADPVAVDRLFRGGTASLAAFSPEAVASQVGATPEAVTPERIREVARTLAEQRPALVIAGGPAAAQTNGLFNVKAALALNALLGSVGVPGGVLFNPPPPLPELDGLGAPATHADWKALVERLDRGQVDLVLIHGANPAYGLANLGFAEALQKAKAIVSFDNVLDESAALADFVLPDRVYLESWGTDIPDPGPGFPVLTVQQPVVRPLTDAQSRVVHDGRPFGDLLLAAGRALGHGPRMPAETMEALVRQRLRAIYQANPSRGSVQGATFEAFWVGVLQRGGWWDTRAVPATDWVPQSFPSAVPASFVGPTGDGTYHLVPFPSIAIREGSSAYLPWAQATPDPLTTATWQTWLEVNSREAHRLGLREGDVVRLEGPEGTQPIEAPVYLHPGIPPTVVGIPLGQGHIGSGRYAQGRGVNPLTLLGEAAVEPTGALAWGSTRVRLAGTGRRVRIPKLEGGMPALLPEDTEIIQFTKA